MRTNGEDIAGIMLVPAVVSTQQSEEAAEMTSRVLNVAKAKCIALGIELVGKHKDKVQKLQLSKLCISYGILPVPKNNPGKVKALESFLC